VKDVCNGIRIILEKGIIGEIYNIGSDDIHEYSVLEIAKLLIEKIKNTTNYEEWITYIPDRPFNDKRYYISNQKLKDLGWDITVNFNDGLNDLLNENKFSY
jgi:dTDP-glucose 4,6-dehydratase/UDP-glucose 4,6-dehydratase